MYQQFTELGGIWLAPGCRFGELPGGCEQIGRSLAQIAGGMAARGEGIWGSEGLLEALKSARGPLMWQPRAPELARTWPEPVYRVLRGGAHSRADATCAREQP